MALQKNLRVDIPRPEPTVTFDVRIGKHVPEGMALDFDQGEYVSLWDAQTSFDGTTAPDVHIEPPGRVVAGHAGVDDDSVMVRFSTNTDKANRFLRHELKHHYDIQQGNFRRDARFYLGNYGLLACFVTVPVGVMGTAYQIITETVTGSRVPDWLDTTNVALAVFSLAAYRAYRGHPNEVRARLAERQNKDLSPIKLVSLA